MPYLDNPRRTLLSPAKNRCNDVYLKIEYRKKDRRREREIERDTSSYKYIIDLNSWESLVRSINFYCLLFSIPITLTTTGRNSLCSLLMLRVVTHIIVFTMYRYIVLLAFVELVYARTVHCLLQRVTEERESLVFAAGYLRCSGLPRKHQVLYSGENIYYEIFWKTSQWWHT